MLNFFFVCYSLTISMLINITSFADTNIETITYPNSGVFSTNAYIALLKESIKQSGEKYITKEYSSITTETRYLKLLKEGTIHVAWTSTSEAKEAEYIPIYIPIEKGVLGYRISFTSKQNRDTFKNVKTVKELTNYTIGQGLGWGDVALYRKNGFKVATTNYEGLFKMVSSNRFHLYPRGITEVPNEVKRFAAIENLIVEPHLVIYYPWPYYFFVNKKSPDLAKAIEKGLEKMIKNGSYEALFQEFYGEALKSASLSKRHIIRIKNPLMTDKTPLHRKELWYTP